MNYLPWSLVKLLHEERVDQALRAVRVNEILLTSKPVRPFRLFESKKTRASDTHASRSDHTRQTTKAS